MGDLSVLFLTLNRLPQPFQRFQFETLTKAVGGAPILSISRQPMEGWNILDTEEPGYLNIYRQMLRGAKMCNTQYIAIAEDDCLYPREHFTLRPKDDEFLYNQHRWALFTWDSSMYSWRNRKSNCTLIAPRELLIEALEERFAKWGDNWPQEFIGELGRERVDRGLGVSVRKSVEVYSSIAVIQFNHEFAMEERQRRKRKSHGNIRALSIPHWGASHELCRHFPS
jgi:hypothetical protein